MRQIQIGWHRNRKPTDSIHVNANDWTRVRAMASAFSRFESPPLNVEVSAGSRLVDIVINPIKKRYPFIDLLQPQNEPVALLLIAFETRLIFHLDKLARLLCTHNIWQSQTRPARNPQRPARLVKSQ